MRSSNLKGLTLTLFFSIIVLLIFYWKILFNLNHVFVHTAGDGMIYYANTLHHIRYDTSYFHQQNMNYPFGENVFFTSCHLPISCTLKFLKDIGIDWSDYTVGIVNGMMLFSLPLCALFLFLIFLRLKLPWLLSSVVAVLLTFLSPQIYRFYGHANLSYAFVIPCVLYLLILYLENKKWIYSWSIALFVFMMSLFHIYYVGIIGALLGSFWIFYTIFYQENNKIKESAKSLFIQVLVPFLLLKLSIQLTDPFTNRTNNPFGFFFYQSYWEGIFLPLQTPLESFFHKFFYIQNYEMEGKAYVGFVATLFFILAFGMILWRMIRWQSIKQILSLTDNPFINSLFWSGMICLVVSYGFPFIGPFKGLINYLGFIKQLRSLGRFAWGFYYAVNISAIYFLYSYTKSKSFNVQLPVWMISFFLLSINVYFYNKNFQDILYNEIPAWSDKTNSLPANQWLNKIDVHKYQASLPLPYTHLGSESIGMGTFCEMGDKIFILPGHTGLSTMAIYSCRTSLNQTYESFALVSEPYRPLQILKSFPSRKPILVMARENAINRKSEKDLLLKCKFLLEEQGVRYYELPYDSLQKISDGLSEKVIKECIIYPHAKGNYFTSDGSNDYYIESFDSQNNPELSYRGKGCLLVIPRDTNVILNKEIIVKDSQEYTLSYWFADAQKDLFGRTSIRLEAWKDDTLAFVQESLVNNAFTTIDGNWVLVESNFPLKKGKYRIKYSFYNILIYGNYIIGDDKIRIDELLLKPSNLNLYKITDNEVFKNNRFYLRNNRK